MRVSGFHAKRVLALLPCLLLLAILPACRVYSVNPLYENRLFESRDKDIILDSGLLGTWKVTNEGCATTLTISSAEQPQYELKMKGEGKECDEEPGRKEMLYEAQLVKLDTHIFLDVSAKAEEVCDSCLNAHQIFLVGLSKSTLDLTPIDSDWLKDAVENRKVNVATVAGNTDILTGSSKDLKEFCRKYADDRNVFKPVTALSFKRP